MPGNVGAFGIEAGGEGRVGAGGKGIGVGITTDGGGRIICPGIFGAGMTGIGGSTAVPRDFASGGSLVSPNCGPRFTPVGTPNGPGFGDEAGAIICLGETGAAIGRGLAKGGSFV